MRDRTDIEVRGGHKPRLGVRELVAVGLGSGLLGGIALAAPIVIWDAANSGHLAFELPMGATAWILGLQHFSNTSYLAWPVVIGLALLAAYAALSGLVFTALADRVYAVARPLESIGAGIAWAFVSFVFFWDMLLPITRDGAPLRAAGTGELFVAPNWVWILGFTLLGVVTGACYGALRTSPAQVDVREERTLNSAPLHRAA